MESERFDALSRSFADRSTRRKTLKMFGAGGLGAAVLGLTGGKAALAADPKTCVLDLRALVVAGAGTGKSFDGKLTLVINDDGAIDDGDLVTSGGTSHPLVGQANGRALDVRVDLGGGQSLALLGVAQQDLILCRGQIDGTFAGPEFGDMGVWTTAKASASDGSSTGGSASGGSSSGGSSSGGSSSGGGSTGDTSGGGDAGGDCASGVVCGGVCCEPAPGLSADNIACNAGACECTYSCASAGCAGGDGSIVNTCGSDPQTHCHSECEVAVEIPCPDVVCDNGDTLDVDSCTCIPAGGSVCADGPCFPGEQCVGGICVCGATGAMCPDGFNCEPTGVCIEACASVGLTNCSGYCADLQNDTFNCGDVRQELQRVALHRRGLRLTRRVRHLEDHGRCTLGPP